MKTTRNIAMTDSEAQGLQSTAVGGKRIGEKYVNDPTTQARGVQSFAAGASCESDGEASISLGMGAKAYQRSSASIGKACRSGLTIAEFNDKYATDTQKATAGYDNTKINGGVSGLSIKDNHEDEYSTSYSPSFASGVETKASGWGAFTSGLKNISAADGSATFGNNNTNKGINAFVAGANNEATVPKSFLFGKGLKQTKGDGLAFVIGKYNEDRGDYVFAIGAGTDTNPKNIFTVNKSSGRVDMVGEAYCKAPTVGYESATNNSIINKGILSSLLASKSNATNWSNGSGVATVVLQEAANTSGSSKRTVVAGHNSKATNADGSAIIAGFSNNVASSFYSSILNGKFNEATHNSCVVGGVGNKTTSNDQTIFGQYAAQDTNALFQVGCGTSTDRKDAITINKNGTVYINDLIPKTSSVNLGSRDNNFNTIYTKYYNGNGVNFRPTQFKEDTTNVDIGYGYDAAGAADPAATTPKAHIDTHIFYDGLNRGGLSWIASKGLVPYQSNEVNFDLKSDTNNLIFGAGSSTKTISRYEFKDGVNNTYSPIFRGSAVLNAGVDTSTTYDFTVGSTSVSAGDIVIPAWSKGVCVSSGNDASIWCTNEGVTKFLFYNKFNNTSAWNLSPVEAPSFNATSDKRLKENIVPFTSEKSVLDLPVYTFNFKSDKNKKKHVGCLAQDLQEICPDLVNEDSQGYLSIEESKITYLLLEEVKELKRQVEELKGKINELEGK